MNKTPALPNDDLLAGETTGKFTARNIRTRGANWRLPAGCRFAARSHAATLSPLPAGLAPHLEAF
eukprot:scaffold2850_cov235-Pinguiococcus_pyrenoidosus.AAC.1